MATYFLLEYVAIAIIISVTVIAYFTCVVARRMTLPAYMISSL